MIRNRNPRYRFGRSMVLAGVVAFAACVGLQANCERAAAGGPHFDPDSPAGKEYALPLDQARDEAVGGGGLEEGGTGASNKASGGSAPLFGEGVRSTQSTGSDRRVEAPGGEDFGQGSANQKLSPSGSVRHVDITGLDRVDAGGGYSTVTGAVLVAAILLAGGALGLGLRVLQRTRSA